jgi:hypothetical protein
VGTAPPTRSALGDQWAEVPAHCSAENLRIEVTVHESRVDGPMRDEYPRASDVPGRPREKEEDRRAREPEGAVDQVEPRPGSIDFDRVAVQIVRDRQEELTGEEPIGIRAARWKVAHITMRPCLLEADRERADPRHTCIRANSRGQRDRRNGEPKDKAKKNRKPLHNNLPSLGLPPIQRLSSGLLGFARQERGCWRFTTSAASLMP